MDSGYQAAGDGNGGRSGGKILKRKRIAAARKTPYDRPTPPPQPESHNWYNGLVYPAKFVAGGASKLLSSFWNPKSWGSHSSSSDSDSDSEGGDIEDDYEDNANLSDGGVELNQNKGSSSGKSEILYLVEQLLMLENYSREECARLIEIINSRVVDYSIRDGVDAGPSKIPSRESPDIRNQTIMEARKLITENVVGSTSKSDLDNRTQGSKSLTTANRDHLSTGSWNLQDEIRRLRSKATEDFLRSHQSHKLTAVTAERDFPEHSLANAKVVNPYDPKPEEETVNLASEGGTLGFSDMRTIQDDIPTEALSSLPTIEEQNKTAEEQDDASNNSEQNHAGRVKDYEVDTTAKDATRDLITESTEAPDAKEAAIGYFNGSQGSSNTNDLSSPGKFDNPHVTRSATRSRRYGRRGRGRGK